MVLLVGRSPINKLMNDGDEKEKKPKAKLRKLCPSTPPSQFVYLMDDERRARRLFGGEEMFIKCLLAVKPFNHPIFLPRSVFSRGLPARSAPLSSRRKLKAQSDGTVEKFECKCDTRDQIEFHLLGSLTRNSISSLDFRRRTTHILKNSSPHSDEITLESAEIFNLDFGGRKQHEKLIFISNLRSCNEMEKVKTENLMIFFTGRSTIRQIVCFHSVISSVQLKLRHLD